jgi:hypothetical protein
MIALDEGYYSHLCVFSYIRIKKNKFPRVITVFFFQTRRKKLCTGFLELNMVH